MADSLAASLVVERSLDWDVRAHEAYFLPFLFSGGAKSVNATSYTLYCDVLLLLTALDGGESVLDRLAQSGAGSVPFEDRWHWRSRIHLQREVWREVERALRWSETPGKSTLKVRKALIGALDTERPYGLLKPEDFVSERVDLRLEPTDDAEVVRTVRPSDSADGELPEELLLKAAELKKEMIVRIGQVESCPSRTEVIERFPALDMGVTSRIMEQVASAFQSPAHGEEDGEPDLVLLPEASIPQPEVQTLRELVADTGRAALAGLYWRVLSPAYRPSDSIAPAVRWFVNEAELIVPVNSDDRGPTIIRWFRVRKPLPAHEELGLAEELTKRSAETRWHILAGQRWYRFVHSAWGDFSIAICSDLLDTAPWRSLRGELLHLFMVAYNKDVDLYDSLTWVRAYENYVNLVAVNHGWFGGSFLWTPRRSHSRELARLRGGRLFLLADVKLPVTDLLKQQREGVTEATRAAAESWKTADRRDGKSSSDCAAAGSRRFKSPPPKYVRRALPEQ